MSRLVVLSLLFGALACGEDNGTGPTFANVHGNWTLSITNLSGGGAVCNTSSPVQMTFQQNTTTFSGSYGGGGVLNCTAPQGAFSAAVGSGSVLNGAIDGNEVTFDLGTADFHHVGTVNGSSMTGTASWTFVLGPVSAAGMLTGSWTATRQ